jgi:hypothetical protein
MATVGASGKASNCSGEERGFAAGAQLSPTAHAALIARLDTKPTKDDWVRYNAWLESRIAF